MWRTTGARLWVAMLAAAVLMPAASAGWDPLHRPSLRVRAPERVVLLAVARYGNRVAAVGEKGVVVVSSDAGRSWRQAWTPISVTLTGVSLVGERGWAVGHGGVVLGSDDGGATWTRLLDGRRAAEVTLNAARVAAARGQPGARQWVQEAERLVAEGPDKPFLDVLFVDERRGYVAGAYGMVLATADGGRSWQSLQHRLDDPRGRHLYAITRTAAGHLYLAGEQGAVYRSTDEGRHFTEVSPPYEGSFFGVVGTPAGAVIVFGLRGHAFRSDDGGRTWRVLGGLPPVSLSAGLLLSDGSLVIADAAGGLWRMPLRSTVFSPLEAAGSGPWTDLVQIPDGSLLLTGPSGIGRAAPRAAPGTGDEPDHGYR